jgi:hypothetical protein
MLRVRVDLRIGSDVVSRRVVGDRNEDAVAIIAVRMRNGKRRERHQ